jgi:DNA-binding NtrC family response regulator
MLDSVRARPRLPRILVVDGDRRAASGVAQWLCGLGYHASAVGSAGEATRSLATSAWDACLIAGAIPGGPQVAVAAASGSRPAAVVVALPASRDGRAGLPELDGWPAAATVVPVPWRDADLLAALEAAAGSGAPTHAAASGFASPAVPEPAILGSHPALRRQLDVAARIAGTPATVLITGESGTGKSLLAREIHRRSGRQGRFVEVACGALADSLLESELFGHVAGAFTGAAGDRDGKFLLADGGTIFLDEIATASPALQVKMLRVLQDMQFEPVGGSRTHAVDARVILATHEDLAGLVAAGRFRGDLFWRINVVVLEMPSLRDRATDIPLLADHFLRTAAAKAGRDVAGIAPAAVDALCRHAWPGNVRELEHAIERGVFLGRGRLLEVADLPPAVIGTGRDCAAADGPAQAAALKQALAAPERRLILEALERCGWRRDEAARSLGINRTTLYKKLKRLGMDLATLQGK